MRAPEGTFNPLRGLLRTTRTLLLCLALALPTSFAAREAVEWVGTRTDPATRTVQCSPATPASRAEAEGEVRRVQQLIASSHTLGYVTDVTLEEDLSGIRLHVNALEHVTGPAAAEIRKTIASPLPLRLEYQTITTDLNRHNGS